MKIINLKEKDLNRFILLSDKSYESIVYLCRNKVFKIFRREKFAQYTNQELINKQAKLLLLNDMDLDERFVKGKELIFINNEFCGYTMDFISFETLDDFLFKNNRIKVNLLKQIKNIIKEAHQKGIILGDINSNNFIIKNGLAYICDLDNCTLGNYKTDRFNICLTNNYLRKKELNQNIDLYLFNILIIYMITKIVPPSLFNSNIIKNSIFGKNQLLWEFYVKTLNLEVDNTLTDEALKILEKKRI